MQQAISRFVQDESGTTSIEYGLIAILISTALIGVMKSLGVSMTGTWTAAADGFKAK